ncbi:hypothetical protein Tco_0748030 [Tanacetum coccineum]|uniref:Uncharacterized protein n=1 Tax=Tanacetum coccineum TaxID=301880 RepID=A0ABQ4YUF2_9ASTR
MDFCWSPIDSIFALFVPEQGGGNQPARFLKNLHLKTASIVVDNGYDSFHIVAIQGHLASRVSHNAVWTRSISNEVVNLCQVLVYMYSLLNLSGAVGFKYDLPLLDRDSRFSLWQVKMRALLAQMDLDDALLGHDKMPSSWTDDDKKRKDRKALSHIHLHLSNNILQEVLTEKTAAALWLKLEQICMTKDLTSKMLLKQKLFSHKLQGGSMMDHLQRCHIIHRDTLTLEEVYEALHAKEKMKHMVSSEGSSSQAEEGHDISECFKLKNKEKKAGTFKPKTNPNDDEKATFVADENSEGEVLVAYVESFHELIHDENMELGPSRGSVHKSSHNDGFDHDDRRRDNLALVQTLREKRFYIKSIVKKHPSSISNTQLSRIPVKRHSSVEWEPDKEKKAGTFKPKTNPNDDEKATFVADENSEGEVLVAYVELGSVLMGDNAHHTKFLRNVVPSHSYNTPVTVESLKVTKALYCDEEEADNKMRGNLYHTSWYYYNSEAGLIEL